MSRIVAPAGGSGTWTSVVTRRASSSGGGHVPPGPAAGGARPLNLPHNDRVTEVNLAGPMPATARAVRMILTVDVAFGLVLLAVAAGGAAATFEPAFLVEAAARWFDR
ncbi:hypothetical protein MF672_032885 [Actinomadura sp. ATCC 31491]|uniref:Uncharacterized protein n=1 Tax=Actinomadura luzonensis TaxID=2805427 RepID=A0ABT0G1S0_9ACTN|nr:hypothetical protein [Actinomadura luzonensis]MCK2218556.1 hypothetical protein [Actinomadura luzonensis]